MSKYTTEVRYICERAAGLEESKGYSDVEQIIQDAAPKIFDFDFPLFDESYRNVLETKILKHYYTREIGFETVGLWKLKLNTKLNEIMPFYNQLYNSELYKFNPLYDTDLMTTNAGQKGSTSDTADNRTSVSGTSAETTNGQTDRTSTTTASSGSGTESAGRTAAEVQEGKDSKTSDSSTASGRQTSDTTGRTAETSSTAVTAGDSTDSESRTHWDLYSDTPQGQLTGVEDGDYLTNARKITDSDTRTGKTNGTDISKGSTSETGTSTGSASETSISAGAESNQTESSRTETEAESRTSSDSRTEIVSGETSRQGSSTNGSSSTGLETGTSSNKFNSTESYVLHVVGKNAGTSYSKMLREFRETFLNIDLEIIGQLSDLFFNLW